MKFLRNVSVLVGFSFAATAQEPLQLIAKIPLGAVSGRIDHLGIDHGRQRLFVAELGNNSVGVVDLAHRTVLKRIDGLHEPQGVAFAHTADVLAVANAGDGSLQFFRGEDLAPLGALALKSDADNLRLDPASGRLWVGYGGGAVAEIDPATRTKLTEVKLKAHPEGFQIDVAGARLYANIPDAGQIAVVDLKQNTQVDAWHPKARANFPMALAAGGKQIAVIFRNPARFVLFDSGGSVLADLPTCGDADDVFADERRGRFYVSCGEGAIDVFVRSGTTINSLARIPTASGGRTSLFDGEADRLYLAVRARSGAPAEIWVLQPN